MSIDGTWHGVATSLPFWRSRPAPSIDAPAREAALAVLAADPALVGFVPRLFTPALG